MAAFVTVISLYDVMEFSDGWWVVEEFEDCGNYDYEKKKGPFPDKGEAEYEMGKMKRRF